MINFALFKANARLNWTILLIFFAVLYMYMAVIIAMYDPENIDAMSKLTEAMPQGMMEAFGYAEVPTDLNTFIALYYYGFIISMFPMIYVIIMANRLVAAHVDRGSMAYLLATPNSRTTIIGTQALYLVASIVILLLINALAGLATAALVYPGQLDPGPFFKLNLTAMTLTLAISGIAFFFSSLFNETRYSLAFGGGIPILFFIINMLRNVGDKYEWLKYLTIYSLFDGRAIITGEQSFLTPTLLFLFIALLLYTGAIYIFNRRNLYI